MWEASPVRAATLFNAPEQPVGERSGYAEHYAPHWERIMLAERQAPAFNATGKGMNRIDASHWRALLGQARSAPETKKMRLVNGFFNQWRPKRDIDAWGTREYWTTPAEFIAKRGGDCEDYAIAKYFALRYLGFSAESLRLAMIRQVNEKGRPLAQLHMVLAVRGSGTWFILDNNSRPKSSIHPHTQYQGRFIPLFSMNELGVWKHNDDPLPHNVVIQFARTAP